MSKHFNRPLEVMERLARKFVETVEDSCVRVQVAGSVRRKKANPSDIEIVVEPKFEWTVPPVQNRLCSMKDDPEPVGINQLDEYCTELIRCGVLEKRQKPNGHTSWGEKEKRYHTWYEPFDDAEMIEQALRFSLSHPVTGVINAGDARLLPMILDAAERFRPMDAAEQAALLARAGECEPLPY